MIQYENDMNPALCNVKPSGIRKFFSIAEEMDNVISLGVGEPDFLTPWHIRREGIDSLDRGATRYTANAGLLTLRFAQYMGINTNVDDATLNAAIEDHPRLSEETVHAFLWMNQENITTKDSELSELFANHSTRISRYQMTSFLFYLCTYELQSDGQTE